MTSVNHIKHIVASIGMLKMRT